MSKVRKVCGGMKKCTCKPLPKNAKRSLCETVMVPKTLYGAETWNKEAAERKKLNVGKFRCLRSMCKVTPMD